MKFTYFAKRLMHRYWLTHRLRRYQIGPGFYGLRLGRSGNVGLVAGSFDSVNFHLNDPKFVHLGDQMFYEPAMLGIQASGCPIRVESIPALTSYLRAMGITDISSSTTVDAVYSDRILHVIPIASFNRAIWINKSVLVVDFTDVNFESSISRSLCKVVSGLLGISIDGDFASLRAEKLKSIASSIALPAKSVLFSNYVDSGGFKITRSARRKLELRALELRADGCNLIHVGSRKEAEADGKNYSFIDLDLRGKTSALELISLCFSPNMVGAVTFDTFVMHAALLAAKPAYVRFKGRFTAASTAQHMRCVNETLAPFGSHLISYIE